MLRFLFCWLAVIPSLPASADDPPPAPGWEGTADPPAGKPDWSADGVKEFPIRTGPIQPDPIWSEPGGRFLAVGSQAGDGRAVYDLKTGEKVGQATHKPDLGPPFALSGDGTRFAGVPRGDAGRLVVCDVTTGQPTSQVKLPGKPQQVAFAGTDRVLCQVDLIVRAYDTTTGAQAWESPAGRKPLHTFSPDRAALVVSPGGRFVAVTDEGPSVRLLRTDTGKLAGTLGIVVPPVADQQPFIVCHGLAFAPDGRRLAAAFRFGLELRVYTWDLRTGREVEYASLPNVTFISNYPDPQFQWSPDGATWLVGHHLLDPKTGKALWRGGPSRPRGRRLLSGLRLAEVVADPPLARTMRVQLVALPKERIETARAAVRAGGVPADAVLPKAIEVSLPDPARMPEVGSVPWRVTPDPAPAFPGPDQPVPLPFSMSDLTTWYGVKAPVAEVSKYDPKGEYAVRSRAAVRVDPQSGRQTGRVELPAQVWLIGADTDGAAAITADADEGRRIDLWLLDAGRHAIGWRPDPGRTDDRGRVVLVSLPAADRVFTLTAGGLAVLWKLPDLKPDYALDIGPLTDPQLTPGGKYLFGVDGTTVRFVEVLTGKPAGDAPLSGRLVYSSGGRERGDFIGVYLPRLVVRPDGGQLAAVVYDGKPAKRFAVRIDLATGKSADPVVTTDHMLSQAGYVGPGQVLTPAGVLDLGLGQLVLKPARPIGTHRGDVARAGYRFWYPAHPNPPGGRNTTPAVFTSTDLTAALAEVGQKVTAPDAVLLGAGAAVGVSVRCEGKDGKAWEESVHRAVDEMFAARGLVRDDQARVTFKAVGREVGPNSVRLELSLEVGGQAVWTRAQDGPRWGSLPLRWLIGDQVPRGLVKVGGKYTPLPLRVHVTADGAGTVNPPGSPARPR
jgi:hypothetical protein